MILTVHLLTGAALAAKIKFSPLALILAFFSHYILDLIPHWEYSIKNIKGKRWGKSLPDFLKATIDFSSGILLIFIFSENQPIIYAGALIAILTDGFTMIGLILSNEWLRTHDDLHQKIHFLRDKKVPSFWKIFSKILVAGLAIFFLIL